MTVEPASGAAIEAVGLRKSYGDVEALRGVDLNVATRSVFGLLGPATHGCAPASCSSSSTSRRSAIGSCAPIPAASAAGSTSAPRSSPGPPSSSSTSRPLGSIRAAAARSLFIGTPAHNDVWGAVVWAFMIIAVFGALSVWRYRRTVSR